MPRPSNTIMRPSESRSDGVAWQSSRLSHFRALLENLEYEYSVLLQSSPAESLPGEELYFPIVEPADKDDDDVIPMQSGSLFAARRSVGDEKHLVSGGEERADKEKDDAIPKERDSLFAAQRPVGDEKRCTSGGDVRGEHASSASVPRVSSLALQDELLVAPSSSMAFDGRASNSCSLPYSGSDWSIEHQASAETERDTLQSRFSEHGSFRRSRRKQVLPIWWNPDKNVLREMMLRLAVLEPCPHPSTSKPKVRYVLSPMAFPKLHWDFLGFALIFYDSWATPFQMIFGSDTLELTWMKHGDLGITCFFALDILLNFNTGLVVKRGICFERDEIVRQYFQSWFWLDLAATVPYDLVYQGASFAAFLRFLKIIKFLKTIRLIRLMNTLKSLQRTDNVYFQLVAKSKSFLHMLGILLVLLLNVHFYCCLWLALSDAVHADTFSKAMHVYFDTYVEIFFALSNGSRLHAQATSKKLIEMVISAEQFIIICLFGAYAIFEALVVYGDTAKSRLLRDQVQRYMTRHGLPIRTQIEVLSGLQESRSAKALQKDFITLTSSDLPEELQQKIASELWERNLMKLGLFVQISEWDEDFCHSLSLLCREEVFATDVVLFREHDLSIAAYYIVTGELRVSCTLIDNDIPSFKNGTWVGESALVNPAFRRGLRVVSLCLSSVMVVSSASFQRLLKESNLWHHFEEFMSRVLFHGLCGRCGSVGDHFFDDCPAQHVQWLSGFASAKKSTCPCWPGGDGAVPVVDQANIRELVDFLLHFEAMHLLPYLQELEVYTLLQLQFIDIDVLSALLEKKDPPGELSQRDKRVLSESCIMKYRDAKAKGMEEHCMIEDDQHLMFLSHYKVEAGTEAALMRSELEQMIDPSFFEDNGFKVPIFLDSEDLTTLIELEKHVKKSCNLVLLLTRGVLSRPWVLVELVTAVRCGIPVVPVQVGKPGAEFSFPTESFYADLLAGGGQFLDEAGKQLLSGCKIDLALIEQTLRKVFQNIAVIYSPHRPAHVRQAELEELLRSCRIEDGSLYDVLHNEELNFTYSVERTKFTKVGSMSSQLKPMKSTSVTRVKSARSGKPAPGKQPKTKHQSPWSHSDVYNKRVSSVVSISL